MTVSIHRSKRIRAYSSSVIKRKKLKDVTVKIIEEFCKECDYCIEFCPVGALKKSKKLSVKGVHPPELISEDQCVGCGLCEAICPDFAIHLEKNERGQK